MFALMNRHWLLFFSCFIICSSLLWSMSGTPTFAASKIYWSKPKSATYSPLYNGVIATNYELAFGGLSISSLSLTTEESEADFVMSASQIGARSIIELNEALETATTPPSSGFDTKKLLGVDSVYLISLHDHSFAKIRIDRMSNSAITFSYVLEEETASPEGQVPAKPMETPLPSNSSNQKKPLIIFSLKSNQILIDGKSSTFDQTLMPRLVEGQTMVPLRFISESLGATLDWEGKEQKISLFLNESSVIMWLDQKRALVNGQPVTLDVAPQKIGNSTFVPIRFISERLQQKVDFDSKTSTITINGTGQTNGSIGNMTPPAAPPKQAEAEVSSLIGSYSLFIPGGAYTFDNVATNIRTDTVFAGAFDGTLTIKSDGTFAFEQSTANWNSATSAYDAGSGKWSATADADYPILLTDSKTGKQFKIGKSLPKDGGDIYVWEVGSTWEIGIRK